MRLALLFAFFLSAIAPAIAKAEPLLVFASVLPVQTLVKKIGGGHVDVRSMVQPGYSPHTYDPTPRQIGALAKAVLYVRTGLPFEHAWMERILSANPRMRVIDLRTGIDLREMETLEPEHDGHHHGHETDPHLWTSPLLARQMAGEIRDALSQLDPDHREEYTRNHAAFVRELDGLDRDIRALLDPLENRKFMVFHPSWGYFADAYGLVQVPIEREGKEPGARALAALIDRAKKEGIRVIFVQPQFDKRQARQVAQAIGGMVIAVDPLAPDYVENLRRVARQFAEALRP